MGRGSESLCREPRRAGFDLVPLDIQQGQRRAALRKGERDGFTHLTGTTNTGDHDEFAAEIECVGHGASLGAEGN